MATTQTKHETPPFETAFEQLKDAGEQMMGTARKAGNLYLDSYEKAVDRAIDFEVKVAGMTEQEWLKSLIEMQVDFTRELTSSYTSAARSLLE
jgi:hypothetical protein